MNQIDQLIKSNDLFSHVLIMKINIFVVINDTIYVLKNLSKTNPSKSGYQSLP